MSDTESTDSKCTVFKPAIYDDPEECFECGLGEESHTSVFKLGDTYE